MTAVVRSNWTTGTVIENYIWAPHLFSLRIQADLMPFKAGQFVRLQLPVDVDGETQIQAKAYSLVNAPQESSLEVFFNVIPNGKVSTALSLLQEGDQLTVSQPANGFFVLDEVPPARDLWMIATGTGLGPYLSMLKTTQPWQRFERVILVHSVRHVNELAYDQLLHQLTLQYPQQFQYISCVTRETNPRGLNSRVTTLLGNGELELYAGMTIQPETSHVMLCGNHSMLEDMKNLLGQRGMQRHLRHKPGHITTEQYF